MLKIFIPLFVIWAILSSYWMYKYTKGKKVNEHLYASIPNVFTTIGVLGTFIGIYIGLQDFNVNDITSSIPPLLEGLKGAFSTSIIGIILSVIFGRISEYVAGMNPELSIDDNTRILNLINQNISGVRDELSNLNNKTETNNNNIIKATQDLEKNLSQSLEEVSKNVIKTLTNNNKLILDKTDSFKYSFKNLIELSSKIAVDNEKYQKEINRQAKDIVKGVNEFKSESKTTSENNIAKVINTISLTSKTLSENLNNNSDKQLKKFDELSEILSENNVKALVEVMEKVTLEFNKQMSELINRLVKENFEELNNSVKQLNTWQIENKQMVSDLTDQHILTTENFKITSDALSQISNKTEEIITNTSKITDENSKVKELLNKLEEIMISDTRFEKASKNVLDAIDTIKLNIDAFDKTTSKLNDWVEKEKGIKDSTNALLVKLDEVSQIRAYNGEFWKETKNQLNEGVNIVSKTTQNLNANLDNINEEFQSQLREVLESLDELIQRIIAKYEI